MKIFSDLKFLPHTRGEGLHAKLDFPNGYGISVARLLLPLVDGVNLGYSTHTKDNEWEACVMHKRACCYNTPITDGVIGHLDESGVSEIMKKIQKLPKSGRSICPEI
jgi:hypothetical protein